MTNTPEREAQIRKQADTIQNLTRLPATPYEAGAVLSIVVNAEMLTALETAFCGANESLATKFDGEQFLDPMKGNAFLLKLLRSGLMSEQARQEHLRLLDVETKPTKAQFNWMKQHYRLLCIGREQGLDALRRCLESRAGVKLPPIEDEDVKPEPDEVVCAGELEGET